MCCIYHCHVYCHPIDWFICFFVFYVWKLFRFKLFQHFRILFSLWLLFSYFSFIPSFVNLVYLFFSLHFSMSVDRFICWLGVFFLSLFIFLLLLFRFGFLLLLLVPILFYFFDYFIFLCSWIDILNKKKSRIQHRLFRRHQINGASNDDQFNTQTIFTNQPRRLPSKLYLHLLGGI